MLDAKFSRNLVKEFRDRLFEKLLKIDVSKLQQKKNGDIMSYFVKDIQEVRKFISNTTTTTVRFFLNFLIVAIAMSKSTNIKLTLMVLLPIFISIILILLNLRKLFPYLSCYNSYKPPTKIRYNLILVEKGMIVN